MFIKKVILISFSLLIIQACNDSNNSIKHNLRKCVNAKLVQVIEREYRSTTSFDFYKLMLSAEHILITNKVLKDNSKDAYLNMFSELFQNKNASKYNVVQSDLKNILHKNKLEVGLFENTSIIIRKCPSIALKNLKNKSSYVLYKQSLDFAKLEAFGFDNIETLKKLFIDTPNDDFNNIIYRASIIYLTLINLDFNRRNLLNKQQTQP